MVKARKAIESLYDGKCTITEHQKVKKENKSTGFQDVIVQQDIPCRLSFKTVNNANQTETAASIVQITKVFLAPEIQVKPGSKLTITQNGVTTDYKSSGEPAFYSTHQEIVLELFKGWA
ncbi:MAG: hypothetical protein O0V67_07265 [Methanocorpusculum sp.]|nr:hypothetical protein [Methanocorpusculum sp.]